MDYRDVIQELVNHGSDMSDEALALLVGPVWTIVDNRTEPDRLVEYTYFRDSADAEKVANRMRHQVGGNFENVQVVMLAPWQPKPETSIKQVHIITEDCVAKRCIDGASLEVSRRLMDYLKLEMAKDGFRDVTVTFQARHSPESREPVPCEVGRENVTQVGDPAIDLTTGIVRAVAAAMSEMDDEDEPPRWMYQLAEALDVPVDWLTSEARRIGE